jgi:NADH-ubiquinone oxidoreductase chain 1
VGTYNFLDFLYFQDSVWFMYICFPIILCWFATSLAETNRTPFDFAEGESELVSGFNVEYRRGGFALIFLAEYSRILFIRMLFSLIFLGGNVFNFLFFLKIVFISFLFIWIRGTLPRFRYDKLIYLAWKSFLPFSLNFLIFVIRFKRIILIF